MNHLFTQEFAEATAEEATKKFSTLQLNFNSDKNESQSQSGVRVRLCMYCAFEISYISR